MRRLSLLFLICPLAFGQQTFQQFRFDLDPNLPAEEPQILEQVEAKPNQVKATDLAVPKEKPVKLPARPSTPAEPKPVAVTLPPQNGLPPLVALPHIVPPSPAAPVNLPPPHAQFHPLFPTAQQPFGQPQLQPFGAPVQQQQQFQQQQFAIPQQPNQPQIQQQFGAQPQPQFGQPQFPQFPPQQSQSFGGQQQFAQNQNQPFGVHPFQQQQVQAATPPQPQQQFAFQQPNQPQIQQPFGAQPPQPRPFAPPPPPQQHFFSPPVQQPAFGGQPPQQPFIQPQAHQLPPPTPLPSFHSLIPNSPPSQTQPNIAPPPVATPLGGAQPAAPSPKEEKPEPVPEEVQPVKELSSTAMWFKDNYDTISCRAHLDTIGRRFKGKFPSSIATRSKDAALADLVADRLIECDKKSIAGHWDKVDGLLNKIKLSRSEEGECRSGLIQERISCYNLANFACQFVDPNFQFRLVPARIIIQEARQAEDGAEKCRQVVRLVKKRIEG